MNNIIKKVLVSEKSFSDAAKGKYTFIVDKNASKNLVARTCQNLFNVAVVSANSMNYNGKIKTTKRIKGKRADFKKVILTLKSGDKIDLFETETAEDKKKKKQDTKVTIREKK